MLKARSKNLLAFLVNRRINNAKSDKNKLFLYFYIMNKIIGLISLLILFISFSCQQEQGNSTSNPQKVKSDKTYQSPAFLNAYYLTYFLENSDIKFYPFVFSKSDKKITKANFYVKNGRMKNNLFEKYTFLFKKNEQLYRVYHFSQLVYKQPYSEFLFNHSVSEGLYKMEVIKYMKSLNNPPINYFQDSLKTTIVVSKGIENYDTTYIFPSHQIPKYRYTRSNNKTIDFELYLPIGTSKDEVLALLEDYSEMEIDEFTNLFVTYIDNELPLETHAVDKEFTFGDKIREWDYNNDWLPVRYREYIMGTMIKDMKIEYSKQKLPSYIRMNKQSYHTFYQFENAN